MSHHNWDISTLTLQLRRGRERWREARKRDPLTTGREFPSLTALQEISRSISAALFPMRLGPEDLNPESEDHYIGYTLGHALDKLLEQARLELTLSDPSDTASVDKKATELIKAFASRLPELRTILDSDAEAAFRGDPAARSVDEVLLCYPGIRAIIYHRLAHTLFTLGLPLLARIIAEVAHSDTGIDIHPGAKIGSGFFIDHGTGVVIGETCVIGNNVRIYQAVTLGAKRFSIDENGELTKGNARHPIVEDDVVIYAGATVLGRVTIGRGSVIGGNVWLTHGVPAGSQISQASSEHDSQI
jgi:serine O-acetyltransferase (EC 2.3.1.30)